MSDAACPPDLPRYLRHVRHTLGALELPALPEGRTSRAVPLETFYVPLRTTWRSAQRATALRRAVQRARKGADPAHRVEAALAP